MRQSEDRMQPVVLTKRAVKQDGDEQNEERQTEVVEGDPKKNKRKQE